MQRRRLSDVAIVSSIVAVVIAGFLTVGGGTTAAPGEAAPRGGAGSEREGAKGGGAEAEDQTQLTQERLDAWRAAKASGTLRVKAAPAAPPSGWAGERVIGPTADDWEPAIAADPNAPYVYLLATRYTGPTACGNQCPLPYHVLKISADGGATWGPDQYLCACRGVNGQFDPQIEVVPNTGAVYAAWMNGYNVVFSKSTNHGQTWTAPVPVYGNVSWNDKPILAVSDNGTDVYIAFNGPTGGDPWIAQSHDAGVTWTQTKIVDSKRYIYAFDGDVLPNGTVVFSETSLLYGGGGALTGDDQVNVYRSTNGGASWSTKLVDTVQIGPVCTAAGCPADYYPGHSAIAGFGNSNLVVLYDGATASGGNETIYAQRSSDGGATWSGKVALST
ncbi:MAG: exo-alpha-sialidase, partial [Actinobacteria bacterium]